MDPEALAKITAALMAQPQATDSLKGMGMPRVPSSDWTFEPNTVIPEDSHYVVRSPQVQEICNLMAGTPGTAHLGCTQRDATMDGKPYAKIIVPEHDPEDKILNHELRHARGFQHK